ncbi:MAG TPA: hypothetical protein VF243_07195, partial [Nitrosospira sp.]
VQERDPDRGNGQLEAGLLAGPDASGFFFAPFFVEVFFSVLGFLVEASFFSGSFSADFLVELVFPGEEVFDAAGFLAETAVFFSVFFSAAFFSGFFSPFFSDFFSAGSLMAFFAGVSFLEAVFAFVSFVSGVFAFAFVGTAAFFSVFFSASSLADSLAGSLAADFLGGVSFFATGFVAAGDFLTAGFCAADFLVVAISTSRFKVTRNNTFLICSAYTACTASPYTTRVVHENVKQHNSFD